MSNPRDDENPDPGWLALDTPLRRYLAAYPALSYTQLGRRIFDLIERVENGQRPHWSRVARYEWRLNGHILWRTEIDNTLSGLDALERELRKALAPAPPSVDDDPPVLGADQLGNWAGHFLSAVGFFGPAIAARSEPFWQPCFSDQRSRGYTHVLINGEQDDWGPSKGHREWTAGGNRPYLTTTHFDRVVKCVKLARAMDLIPVVGLHDQQALKQGRPLDVMAREAQQMINATYPWVCMYMINWEINECFRTSTERERWEDDMLRAIDWQGRDVGLHYSAAQPTIVDHEPGYVGGINRFKALEKIYPGHVVHLLQFHNEAPREVLVEQVKRTAKTVHADHGVGKFCAFEFASELNQPKIYTSAQVAERRRWIMDAVEESGLPPHRRGHLN